MEQFLLVAVNVVAVYLVVGAGMLARGVGWLRREADESFMKVTAYLLIPCFFFSKVVGDPKLTSFAAVLQPIALGFGTTVLGFLVAGVAAWTLWRFIALPSAGHRRAFTLCTGVFNYGYIPLPIAIALYSGSNASTVPTMLVFNVGVEIALWTAGIVIISGGLQRGWWKHIFNPPAVSIALAVVINSLGWSPLVPQIIRDAAHSLGASAIPIGLLISGAVMLDLLREMKPTHGLSTLAAGSVLRMGLLPLAFLSLAMALPMSLELKQVLLIQAAMPAAMFPIVVTRLYKQDTETAVRIVVGTSLLGVLTIPLWITIGRAWLGV